MVVMVGKISQDTCKVKEIPNTQEASESKIFADGLIAEHRPWYSLILDFRRQIPFRITLTF